MRGPRQGPATCSSSCATAPRGRGPRSSSSPAWPARPWARGSTPCSPQGCSSASGEAASTGGRPPARLAFNPDAGVVLGADLGATHALVALTDLRGRVVAEKAVRHRHLHGPASGPRPRGEDRTPACSRTPAAAATDLAGVGIGLPGPVEHSTGRPVLPPIMPGWDHYDVAGHVSGALGGPVLVDNDVNLMALGEHATVYPHVEHMIFVKVATGIGAGIISGGRLHRGAQGAAGDLGHVAAPHGGDTPCTCGNVGCLEAVASGPAVVRALRERGVEAGDSGGLVRLAKQGDLVAAQAIREAGREIGYVLATCVSLLNPSVIAVGRLLAQSAEGPAGRHPRGRLRAVPPPGHRRAADRRLAHRGPRRRHRRGDDDRAARAVRRAGRAAGRGGGRGLTRDPARIVGDAVRAAPRAPGTPSHGRDPSPSSQGCRPRARRAPGTPSPRVRSTARGGPASGTSRDSDAPRRCGAHRGRLAVAVGFEPTEGVNPHTLSRSAARHPPTTAEHPPPLGEQAQPPAGRA